MEMFRRPAATCLAYSEAIYFNARENKHVPFQMGSLVSDKSGPDGDLVTSNCSHWCQTWSSGSAGRGTQNKSLKKLLDLDLINVTIAEPS